MGVGEDRVTITPPDDVGGGDNGSVLVYDWFVSALLLIYSSLALAKTSCSSFKHGLDFFFFFCNKHTKEMLTMN